ncbi:uncharacterized protein EDB91DRAFT_13675 [Suillus paluster]|uniref:uncharacterized protein n=1 Tax=Suillus paluster TaxID=48578 RepID=UPI001B8746E0|nr:uncharacterized protein EDB91DRAFT_13675 [Suillus paluster]KAG1756416.1 hypothetical protein EDB91DRAFT_13675 [Suillus paluster]
MSFLPRLFKPPAANCRAYSSFFSSKPGGGRYFNSTKPPKPVVSSGRAKVDNGNTSVASSDGTSSSSSGNGSVKMKVDENPSIPASNAVDASRSTPSLPFTSHSAFASQFNHHVHPTISSQDFNLHQFFSLHRPLLLLSQPPSTIFESAPQDTPLFQSPEEIPKTQLQSEQFPSFDDPPESSFETDADAARQLGHALVMNRVGGMVSWHNTLARLGLGGESAEGSAINAKESAQEWVTIHADSTKRKKRKKMKKHKLKKRRRLTRMQRQNAK